MAIRYPITLSTTEPNNNVGLLKIRQADEQTQTLVVDITANGQPKSYEGLQPFFCAKLGQSLGLGIIEQKLDVAEMTNPKAGQLEYTFRAEDWQQIGRQVGYFSFRKMSDEHEYVEQFTTRDFYFNVTKNIFSDGLTEVKKDGSTYVWTIEDLIRLFNEYIASGKSDWEEFVDQNREVLESVDPGGKLIGELIDARRPFGGEAYPTLGERLDSEKAEVTAQLAQTDMFQLEQRNAKMPLNIRTYDGSGQATHPSVVRTPGLGGFRYWMAYTPYPDSNDDYENPCIQRSNNGMEWGGDLTPIDKPTTQQTNDGAYMSDVELKYINGQLECFYRFNTATEEVLLRKTSTNGTTWSEREVIYNSPTGGAMSPTVIHENGLYRMWYVRNSGDIFYVESSTGELGTWSTPIIVPISYRNESYRPWHIQVFKDDDNTYKLILNANETTSTSTRHLLIGTSTDGLSFEDTYLFMSPLNRPYTFDKTFLYRASLVKGLNGEYMFYYSAYSNDTGWRIGMSGGKTIDGIQGIDYTTLKEQKMLEEIRTPKVEVKDEAYFTNDELLFRTAGVKSAKLKNTSADEISVLTEQDVLTLMKMSRLFLTNGVEGKGVNLSATDTENVLKVGSYTNANFGHLEVAHLLLKYTTNTLNIEGALRYNPDDKKLEFYNGTSWETVTSS